CAEARVAGPAPEQLRGTTEGDGSKALGCRRVRHGGKVPGLAATGEPVLAERIGSRFWVDETGRILCDLPTDRHIRVFIRLITRDVRREDVAASVQKVLEDVMLLSL